MTPPENVQVYDFPTTKIWFDNEGVFYSTSRPGAPSIGLDEAVDFMKRLHDLVSSQKVCMIVKVNASDNLPKKKVSEYLAKELEALTTAMAVVYDSPLGRMVANVYFGLAPRKYPMKFFGNVEDAKKWMGQYLKK